MDRLYGRGKVINFAKEALKCEDIGDQPLPLLLLTGPHGSGGTALLAHLWDEIGDDGPCVRLDVANAEEISRVLWIAMSGLQRHIWGIRRLRFPRLSLAFKALAFPGDGSDREAFNRHMKSGGRATEAVTSLQNWTDEAAPLLLSTPEQQAMAKASAHALREVVSGIDRRRGQAILRWFEGKGDTAPGDGLDCLWQLYHWQRGEGQGKHYQANKLLCDAFLTDMRTGYGDAPRTRNPGLLLDNADSRVGKRLLELIEECRRQNNREGEPADPLLVVSVRHQPPSEEIGAPVEAADRAVNFARWYTAAVSADHLTLWFPVRLSDLRLNDVIEMVPSRVLGASDHIHRDADFVRSLTGGHPEATACLAEILPRLDDPRKLLDDDLPLDLRDKWRVSGAAIKVRDYLLRRAFPEELAVPAEAGASDVPKAGAAMLTTMAIGAATPGFRLGACNAALRYCRTEQPSAEAARDRPSAEAAPDWPSAEAARDRLNAAMWRTEQDDREPRLHPLAEFLLRHWLAREPGQWTEAHEGYVTFYSSPASAVLRYRHKLALVASKTFPADAVPDTAEADLPTSRPGELDEIVSFLDRQWKTGPAEETEEGGHRTQDWLGLLDTIVSAPNLLRTSHYPETYVRALAGPVDPGDRRQVFARLTVARWLFNDRLFDPGHQLARVIADEYRFLAQLAGGDGDLLLEEEAKYRKIQREWED